ncbi:flagellar biosynthesis protein FlgB [Nocardioides sp. GY 10113]|uniref:flagellar basal body rod protein FlgB n=1 Tax=Nocardioides sp. GY 10113 TaxID=2569761 RepID=UPI0010A8C7BA|nr:flagellar basal body protein [Nocardioides sp. GY 10113]TIC83518.1 flagellar biosynthesis protein FlgB [Nocardioides sp. GY 10113]
MSFAATDAVGLVLHTAINGLALRQQVTADNIANVDTPGFRASAVEFESALSAAIQRGGFRGEVTPTTEPTTTPLGENGNNVDLRKESLSAIQTQYQYQIMGRAISDRHTILTTVAGAQ